MKTLSVPQLLAIYVPALGMLILAVLASRVLHVPLDVLTNDLSEIANVNPLTGALSSLGAFLWCATAAICFFSAAALFEKRSESAFKFLLYSALLSAYLCFDGFFSFHEFLARYYFGLNEKIIYLTLIVMVASYLFAFKANILDSNFALLLAALALFSCSVAIDLIPESWNWVSETIWDCDDSIKWLGIVSWCGYYVDTCYRLLFHSVRSPASNSPTDRVVNSTLHSID